MLFFSSSGSSWWYFCNLSCVIPTAATGRAAFNFWTKTSNRLSARFASTYASTRQVFNTSRSCGNNFKYGPLDILFSLLHRQKRHQTRKTRKTPKTPKTRKTRKIQKYPLRSRRIWNDPGTGNIRVFRVFRARKTRKFPKPAKSAKIRIMSPTSYKTHQRSLHAKMLRKKERKKKKKKKKKGKRKRKKRR